MTISRSLTCALALGLAFMFAGAPATAERRVYSGDETEALKCVWIISMTASALERAALVSTRTKESATLVSAAILNRYVSGTEQQKIAALKIVGERRTILKTFEEFRDQSDYCIRKFPLE